MAVEIIEAGGMSLAETQESPVANASGEAGGTSEATGAGATIPAASADQNATGAEKAVGAEGQEVTKEPEPTVKIGDREVPLSQAQKAIQEYERDSGWQEKNRRESEALNKERERLRRAEIIAAKLDERQDLYGQLFAPAPTRNFDEELEALHKSMPDPYNRDEMAGWNVRRDKLLLEKQSHDAERIATARAVEAENDRYHNDLEAKAKAKYVESGKITPDEYVRMRQFILENAKTDQRGRVGPEVFDMAYKLVFADKYEAEIALRAAAKAVAPLRNANGTGAEAGVTKRTPPPTPEDTENEGFVNRVRQSQRGGWTPLP